MVNEDEKVNRLYSYSCRLYYVSFQGTRVKEIIQICDDKRA